MKNQWILFLRCATTADYDRDSKWGNCIGIKCFKFVDDPKGYFEARSFCNNDDAKLTSISNDYEQSINQCFPFSFKLLFLLKQIFQIL